MFEQAEDTYSVQEEDSRASRALRAGLRDLPTLAVSADFDLRIQAALQRPSPCSPVYWATCWRNGWTALWTACRPALPAALCTLTGMLLLLQWMQQSSGKMETAVPLAGAQTTGQKMAYRGMGEGADYGADGSDLTNASLELFRRPPHRGRDTSG